MTAPLRYRGFRNLWLGQAISQFGDALYFIVFMFMASEIAGSSFVGWVAAAETLPFLILGPYAGVIADRVDRRKILLLSDYVSAAVLASFAVYDYLFQGQSGWAIKAALLIVPFALSCVRCFFFPARGAAIPALVPEAEVLPANALSTLTMSISQIGGLALSAVVIAPIYEAYPGLFLPIICALNAVSFMASAVFIAKLPTLIPEREVGYVVPHPLTDFREGFRFVGRRIDLILVIVVVAALRFFVAPFFVVFTAANKQWFGGKPTTLAWFEFAFFLGMLVTSPIAARWKVRRPLVAVSLAFAVAGVTILGFGFTKILILFLVLNFIAGLAIPMGDIPLNAYMQLSVPDAFRGRVQAVLNMVATGVMPVGAVVGGVLAERLGLVTAFIVMGAGVVVPSVLALLAPSYRTALMPEATPAEAQV